MRDGVRGADFEMWFWLVDTEGGIFEVADQLKFNQALSRRPWVQAAYLLGPRAELGGRLRGADLLVIADLGERSAAETTRLISSLSTSLGNHADRSPLIRVRKTLPPALRDLQAIYRRER